MRLKLFLRKSVPVHECCSIGATFIMVEGNRGGVNAVVAVGRQNVVCRIFLFCRMTLWVPIDYPIDMECIDDIGDQGQRSR